MQNNNIPLHEKINNFLLKEFSNTEISYIELVKCKTILGRFFDGGITLSKYGDYPKYLVIDLEATTGDRGDKGFIPEIIEFAAMVVTSSYNIEESKGISKFIKPKINPILSDFCKKLTGIKQSDIDTANTFDVVLNEINEYLICTYNKSITEFIVIVWGSYDKKLIDGEFNRMSTESIIGPIIDIGKIFKETHRAEKNTLMGALNHLGLEFEGNHHEAISDAYNTARILSQTKLLN